MIIQAPHETVQRCCDGHAALDIRHIGTAVQCMACAVQFISDTKWWLMALTGLQVIRDHLQVARCLLRENIVQHRIHFERRLFFDWLLALWSADRQHCRIWISISKCMGSRNKQTNICIRFCAHLELLDEFRYSGRCLYNEFDHWRCALQCPVDQSIKQILDSPAVFTNALRTDHATAALERVERPARCNQHLQVVGRGRPGRQVAPD